MESSSKFRLATAAALGLVGAGYLFWRQGRMRDAAEAFKHLDIQIITSEDECDKLVNLFRSKTKQHRAIGFDCEWVTDDSTRQPVALLQLSTLDGCCGLFRLNEMKGVPASLKDLLEDKSIYKIGVAPLDDAKLLLQDYNVRVKSTLDLRHLAQYCGYHPGGLANLAKNFLRIILDKSWRIRCSDWEAETLTQRQITYAAADAHVAITIFGKLLSEIEYDGWWSKITQCKSLTVWNNIDVICSNYADVSFKAKIRENDENNVSKKRSMKTKEPKKYTASTRSKPLYDNCMLQAPDGELLCTCDSKKAMWYVEKSLAVLISESPMCIRLNFEPAGRSVGDVGRYYQVPKQNRCVVCGSAHSYIRKNVVPREYRKCFPEIMKEHSSHDVLLLCSRCHQRSNVLDFNVRERLANMCDAPIAPKRDNGRLIYNAEAKKSRSYAYTLLNHKDPNMIPEDRRREMAEVILRSCPGRSEMTVELLEEVAARDDYVHENTEFEGHGTKVVEHYMRMEGGLLKLEEMWRKHFLESMKPQHMHPHWSVKHNEDRLRIKFNEGRLKEEDIKLLGLNEWLETGLRDQF